MQKIFKIIIPVLVIFLLFFLLLWKLDSVDIEGSEDIYISDAVGYLRGDPYMVPRHHLRKPHYPASPHPFLYQLLLSEIFKGQGLSIFSSRLLSVFSTLLTGMVLMFLGWRIFKSQTIATFSGLLFSVSALIIRFGRMAILDPLVMCIQTIGALFIWEFLVSQTYTSILFAGLSGVVYGLSLATKLSGVFYILLFTSVWLWKLLNRKTSKKIHIISFLVYFISSGLIFYLFSDPASYIYGWFNFSDPKYKNITILAFLKGLIAFKYWYLFITGLVGVVQFALIVISFRYIRKFWASRKKYFLISWLSVPLSYLLLNPPHVTGLSAEWSYLPLIPPVSLISGYVIFRLLQRKSMLAKFALVCLMSILSTYGLIAYGLRMKPLPLATYRRSRNVLTDNLAVTTIINRLNEDNDTPLVLINLKGVAFPLWLLNANIKTEPRYHKLSEYDYVVTDNKSLVEETLQLGFQEVLSLQNPTENKVFLLNK